MKAGLVSKNLSKNMPFLLIGDLSPSGMYATLARYISGSKPSGLPDDWEIIDAPGYVSFNEAAQRNLKRASIRTDVHYRITAYEEARDYGDAED